MKKKIISLIVSAAVAIMPFAYAASVSADNGPGYLGTVYYVDADSGSDSADGMSEKTAWRSLDKVNATAFEPGDAVLLKRGCSWTGSYLYPKGSGERGKPITVSTYGEGDKPVISDNFESLDSRKVCATVYLYNQSYIVIENLFVTNTSVSTDSMYGIRVVEDEGYYTEGVEIRGCTVYGSSDSSWLDSAQSGMTGIEVSSTVYYGFIKSVLIEDNEIYNCKSNGIIVNGAYGGCNQNGSTNRQSGRNVVVRGNYLKNIGKDGILVNNCVSPLVEYNTCDRAHSYATTSWHVAMWPFACYNATFRYNEAFNTQTTYDATGFDCDYQCYNTLFEYNYSHDNMGGFMLICCEPQNWDGGNAWNIGATVRYNISQDDQYRTFSLVGAIDGTRIYNNTIYCRENLSKNSNNTFFQYSKGTSKFNGRQYADDTLIANNIFYVDSNQYFDLSKTTNTVFDNNLVFGKYAGNAPQNDVGQTVDDGISASGNIFGENPLFINAGGASEGLESCEAYILYDDSPAIGAGKVIDGACDTDFFGNRVSAESPNIGAYGGAGMSSGEPDTTTAEQPVIKGDLNRDSAVNIEDLLIIKKCIALESTAQKYADVADLNVDGIIDIIDILIMKKAVAAQ